MLASYSGSLVVWGEWIAHGENFIFNVLWGKRLKQIYKILAVDGL